MSKVYKTYVMMLFKSPHYFLSLHLLAYQTNAFCIIKRSDRFSHNHILSDTNGGDSYETSDVSSKGVVSSLTGIVNFFMGSDGGIEKGNSDESGLPPPRTPIDLLEEIRRDYVEKNYLWTGDIYLPAFEKDCTFTDPTLSFSGRDKFVSNVKNLVPIVKFLKQDGTNKSDLLDISLNEDLGYVETRWNMVGDLYALPWKPAIDVIGRTKFWYRQSENEEGYQVYFYDEAWELEATRALLQLVTPKGTMPNKS